MYSLLFLVACLSASALAIRKPYYDINKAPQYFSYFTTKYDKSYKFPKEEEYRFDVFVSNLKMVNSLNSKNELTAFGITQFMDLTLEEIIKHHTGLAKSDFPLCKQLSDDDIHDDISIPESWDWRNNNVVSRVKDQGGCSASWAFSAIGQLESLYAIKYRKRLEFSEQLIINCDFISDGCCGGYLSTAFNYLIDNKGPCQSKDYPYEQDTMNCNGFSDYLTVANVTNCYSYNLKSQEKLKQLLYQHGPVSVAIKVSGLAKHYLNGILADDFCADGNLDHTVLLVGYGSENNIPYWIVKNSWGEEFGEDGYFRLQRGDAYSCGMMNIYMTTAEID